MECPKCLVQNPEGRKFCRECGSKLAYPCPGCGAEVEPGDKFCGHCGHDLQAKTTRQELSLDQKLTKLQGYLPQGLIEKILAQKGKIEGERKQVTVLFADMENFTPLVEQLGPEEAYAVMDQVYEVLIHTVHRFEGTVNEMTGDGIMALFGAPIALEDAPQRAIRSALAIHAAIARLSDKLKRDKHLGPVRMRIGIHTGPVVVGTLGNDLRVEFKAVGDTVNIASRVQNLAEAGTTWITSDIFTLTEGMFRFESLGEKAVKGKEQPVRVYQVVATSSSRARFDVSAERGLTPLVGRSRELEQLLDGLDRAKQGRGQAFSVIGEAGIGKSRVLYEFRKALAAEDITLLEGRCLSYGKGAAYHPIADLLKGAFDINDADGEPQVMSKVKSGMDFLNIAAASAAPYVLELLGVKDSGLDQIQLSPEGKKDRIIETLKQVMLKTAEHRPLILAVEDLHWADESSEEAAKYLLEGIPAAPILMIFTYRPDFVHTWGGKSFHNQISLNRLTNRESMAMAASLLGTEQVDEAIEELILARTEGVPFFIEEFIKSLKDLNIISKEVGRYRLVKDAREIKIPATIQDMIMARVDSLPPRAKELLQIGSVIEREFSYEMIQRVTDLDDKALFMLLAVLKESELLYERGIFPNSTYVFKHALTREVLYDSILATKKKTLHAAIGSAIEALYADDLEQHYGVLAAHFVNGENYAQAAEYDRLAGKRAEKSAAFPDAIAHARTRIACLEKLNQTDEVQKKIIDTRTVLGLYFLQLTKFVEAKEAIGPIVEPAIKQNYKKRICHIKIIEAQYHQHIEENVLPAYEAFEEAIKIGEEMKDMVGYSLAHFHFSSGLWLNCEYGKSHDHMQKALDVAIAANNPWGIAVCKGNLALFALLDPGKIELAFQHTAEAKKIAEETGDIYSKTSAYSTHGWSCFAKGYWPQTEQYLRKALEYSERLSVTGWNIAAHMGLAEVYAQTDNWEASAKWYRSLGRLLQGSHLWPSIVGYSKIGEARAKVHLNQTDVDLEKLCFYVENIKLKRYRSLGMRMLAEIFLVLAPEHLSKAEDWIDRSIEEADRNKQMYIIGVNLAFKAEVLKSKGDISQAREHLGEAIRTLEACGADGWVEKYRKELAV